MLPEYRLWLTGVATKGNDTFTETAKCTGTDVQTELHPEAVERGCRIAAVGQRTGKYGDYQEIQLIRRSPADALAEGLRNLDAASLLQ